MSRSIPNEAPVGNDYCLTPVMVKIPLIIVDYDGADCLWYPEVMDRSAADRMSFGMMRGSVAEAFRLEASVILPAASDVRAITADLDRLTSKPVRLELIAE
ncbi:MAG: hypothetical protein AAGG48_17665 [Planctomycetota bacterium]